MKNHQKKIISGIVGVVGMFCGLAMLVMSMSSAGGTGRRFAIVIVGYMSVFLATIYFGKAIRKEEKKPEEAEHYSA